MYYRNTIIMIINDYYYYYRRENNWKTIKHEMKAKEIVFSLMMEGRRKWNEDRRSVILISVL